MIMETKKERILNEAIRFELSMSKLYTLFQTQFKKDSDFWGQLADEEKRHAQIILKFKPFLSLDEDVSDDFTSVGLSTLVMNNIQVQKAIESFTQKSTREDAFRTSIKLENSSSEENYRLLLSSEADSKILSVFQTLNGEDRKHYQRIIDYIIVRNIKI